MHIDTHLGVDVLAHEADEQLSVLIELTAPARPATYPGRLRRCKVVLDRSGSMQGERLAAAQRLCTP